MPSEWSPDIDTNGKVDIDSMRLATVDNLRSWISRVLRSLEPRLQGTRDQRPHLILAELYRELDPGTRECFRDSIVGLLDMQTEQSAEKSEKYCERLLFLTGDIYSSLEASLRNPVAQKLRRLADSQNPPSSSARQLLARALQALVSLEYVAPPSFWKRKYPLLGEEDCGLILSGLAVVDLDEALNWLSANISSERAADALITRVPFLLKRYPKESREIGHVLNKVSYKLSPEAFGQLQAISSVAGLRLKPSPFTKWSREDLVKLGQLIGFSVGPTVRRVSDFDLVGKFTAYLLTHWPPREDFNTPRAALAFLGACRAAAGLGDRMPIAVSLQLAESAEDTVERYDLDERFLNELIIVATELREPSLSSCLLEHAA